MNIKSSVVFPACLFGVYVLWITGSAGTFVSNLNEACYRCLCHVSTLCNWTAGCTEGYCGPFHISRIYWVEAGEVVLPNDEPTRPNAWKDCARSFNCSKKIIEGYMEKLGKDCNGDGVTDCFDYLMINENGGFACTTPLQQMWIDRFKQCQL
ncbi:lysozyme 1-like isoform X2 [Anticarsia gemmatalis]|uniref:lysozyme 1-like isoform X2 n=1 Tax=Anticarsia gemmatalis TaxID=129554 RepID=UPI003F759CF5